MTREERVAVDAYRVLYSDPIAVAGAVVLRMPAAPSSPMVNRIIGLGVGAPATETALDEAIAAMGEGLTYYVAVAPAAEPPALTAWLRARGFEPGWGWMAFRRGVEDLPAPETSLRLVEVGPAEAEAFGRVVTTGYGLPAKAAVWTSRAHELGWTCWLALDGDEPAAAGALFVSEGAGYLGIAATLPEHRRKGAQNALLAVRIRRARELGCDVVVTETGELRDDLPGNSYRNILRAGFVEVAVTANWLRQGHGH